MNLLWCLCLLIVIVYAENADDTADPCTTAYVLDKMDFRLKENVAYNASMTLCDRYRLGKGRWVRADGQDLLQTEPRPEETCGTRYAIWMREPPPEDVGELVEREACVVGLRGSCSSKLPIKIKKCMGYNVYFLTPPTSCHKAYCFQYAEKGTPPTETVSQPVVAYKLIRQMDVKPYQELQFSCEFPLKKVDYYYQVVWYIEDTPSVITEPVKKHSLQKTYLGYGHGDATKGYNKLGINVKCSVRLKVVPEGPPGPMSKLSENFFAGIQVKSTRVDINRDKPKGEILIQLTVPFGCPLMLDDKVENCPLEIEMNVPRDPMKCTSEIKAAKPLDLIGQGKNCGYRIWNTEWQKIVSIPVAFIDKPEYKLVLPDSPEGAFRIGMITGQKVGSPAWSGIELQDVYVHIHESSDVWKGKECAALNDPHMYTFDRRPYENQYSGRFVLYRGKSTEFPTEVQIETTQCNRNPRSIPYCVCAIAVRAGGDVFVIDRCPNRRIQIKYLACKDNLIDARKESELEYKIYFPSGTYVNALLQDYTGVRTINVHMYPSKADKDETLGLCGTLNGNQNDDFMDKDGNLLVRIDFINHWRVTPEEFLVLMSEDKLNALSPWKGSVLYCTCPHKQVTGDRPEDIGQCSEDTIVQCAKEDNPALNKNKCRIRSRRSARRVFSHKMFEISEDQFYHIDEADVYTSRIKREADIIWSKSKAQEYCNNFMKKSQTFDACSSVPSVNSNFLMENCVLDILLTNSTIWSAGTREALRTTCMKELSQNTTLKEDTKEGKPSIAQQIKKIACMNECSWHGNCLNGSCNCEEGYGGKDCSMDLNKPPIVYGVNIEEGSLCDKRTCQRALVEGYGFLDQKTLMCSLRVYQVAENKSVVGEITEHKVPGEHDSIAEIFCPLDKTRVKRSVNQGFVKGIDISVSNNGQNFSTTHTLFVLDVICQDTVNISGDIQFTLRKGYCYIGGRCIVHGSNGTEECMNCNSSKNTNDWSKKEGCPYTTEKSDPEVDDSLTLIIVPVVVGVLLVVTIIIAVILFLKKRTIRQSGKTKAEVKVSYSEVATKEDS
ncbi:von Willebrand factor D and EGF domain-containing protein-like [Saccostrea echinata]|uniref:von Willebrand factor D and EGF domain-containing protein-like n=1 Tax=Saccostrea echinata TaxID=191078 RepID=UPI002A8309DC|nr:von Willebrand factor D and EGF domain-containing protein-like [Saccostrea echinata]